MCLIRRETNKRERERERRKKIVFDNRKYNLRIIPISISEYDVRRYWRTDNNENFIIRRYNMYRLIFFCNMYYGINSARLPIFMRLRQPCVIDVETTAEGRTVL